MVTAEERLKKEIEDHPKTKVSRAYKLGLKERAKDIAELREKEQELLQRIERLEYKARPSPEDTTKGKLKVYWKDGATSVITLASTANLKNLVSQGHFLIIEEDGRSDHGDIINLDNVFMLSQY